jgi:HTH-type transcriptional regulator/antitoxin HigA
MAKDIRLEYEPTTATHPGETVIDYLEYNGWSQRDLARRTGLTPKTISEICNGKAPITPQTALALENVLKRPAHFWLNLQRQFDEAEARRQASVKLEQWKGWAERFPLKTLKSYGWIEMEGPHQSEVGALLNFLGVSSPDSWNSVWAATNVAYRQTRKFHTTIEAMSAWVRAAELLAGEIEVKEFDEDRLRASLKKLRQLSRKSLEDFIPEIEAVCADAGVAFVLVPALPYTGISGCAYWLADKKAFIALTLRYKTDDQFWFTFFHEVAHLLLHRKKHNFILDNAAETLTDQVVDPQMQRFEEEANRFAADTLIPPEELSQFIQRGVFTNESIYEFSEKIDIGPGIVVGRLQREGLLRYHQGDALKQRFNAQPPSKS